jgi:hypothetical protein
LEHVYDDAQILHRQFALQVAFDKHWNLALVDVDETYSRKRFPKTSNFDVESISRELEEMNVSAKNVGEKSSKSENSGSKRCDKNLSKSKSQTDSKTVNRKDRKSSKSRVDEKARAVVKREQVKRSHVTFCTLVLSECLKCLN